VTIDDGILFEAADQPKRLHPALDIIEDTFYFGFQLPVEVINGTQAEDLCFVTSNHDCIRRENLGSRKIKLRVPSVVLASGWNVEDMHNFLIEPCANNNYKDLPFQIHQELKKYIEFPDEKTSLLVSLWIIGTYLQPIWDAYGYLSVTGTKRSGKTKFLKFLSMLAFNPVFSADTSAPMLFRLIESLRCTFLLDESEKYASSDKQEEVRNIINGGYQNNGAKVLRSGKTEKGQIVPESFEAYSPKAIVSYKGLEQITEDRCIPIIMLRTVNKSIGDNDIHRTDEVWQGIRNQLYRFALDKFLDIREIYITESFDINFSGYASRERELWKPIFTLASYFGMLQQIREYAIEKMKEKQQQDLSTRESILLQALADLIKNGDNDYYVSDIRSTILELTNNEDVDKYSTRWIGSTLSRQYNLANNKTKDSSSGGKNKYFLTKEVVKDLCDRYGVYTKTEFEERMKQAKKPNGIPGEKESGSQEKIENY
jgi:hypothetical protein